MWAMLNFSGSSSAPSARIRPTGTPGSSTDPAAMPAPSAALPAKYRCTISTGNRSIPAGTGVWVVNTVLDRTTVSAVSKSRPGVDEFADPLGAEEPGVALVHVEHLGRGQPFDRGERADRPHAADPGEDLLLHAMFLVTAVEAVGDPAHVVLVLGDVGIQQQQRHPTDLGDPDPRPQRAGFRQRQLDQRRRARGVGEQTQRQSLPDRATG